MDHNQSPEQIFAELDRHVIGQPKAKRAVAIALRNRWRRLQLTPDQRKEIHPHHLLLIGPSGCGKTAIAKRLADLSNSPFIKVEATQYTEVGYVGKEVTSIVEEVVAAAEVLFDLHEREREERERKEQDALKKADRKAAKEGYENADPKIKQIIEEIIDLSEIEDLAEHALKYAKVGAIVPYEPFSYKEEKRKQFRMKLYGSELDLNQVRVPNIFDNVSLLGDIGDKYLRSKQLHRGKIDSVINSFEGIKATSGPTQIAKIFRDAKRILRDFLGTTDHCGVVVLKTMWSKAMGIEGWPMAYKGEEPSIPPTPKNSEGFADFSRRMDELTRNMGRRGYQRTNRNERTDRLIEYAENYGIVFIDEFDKLAGQASVTSNATRQGVQRDLLPLLDGCKINTRYGEVDTSNMLFICSGAFQLHKPEDLMVEIQGRLPIQVHLEALTIEDFIKILSLKDENILAQYKKLMGADGIDLTFDADAVAKIAETAFALNLNQGNFGARRLFQCVEKVLEDVTYLSAPPGERIQMKITKTYIENHLGKQQ
jgi:ATP-dependent protease HslVU (ClpYQ) ATPase subunit